MSHATKPRRKLKGAPPAEILTLEEAARFLRLSPKTVEHLVAEQGLPGRKIGKEWRFLRGAIERWLEPALSHGGSILDQAGIYANDPQQQEFVKQLEENRKRWDRESA